MLKLRRFIFIVIGLVTLSMNPSYSQTSVHPWEPYEITFESQATLSTPYVDSLPDNGEKFLEVVFQGVEGEAQGQSLNLTGFWEGSNQWKVRFSAPAAGRWTYQSKSKEPSLNGKTGEILVNPWSETEKQENPTRRGFIRVCTTGERLGRYFEYSDGTPFLWIGDTWWNWTKRGIKLESFQKLADDRADKGFTVGQLFFAGQGWGRRSALLDRSNTQPDLEQIREVEAMIRYANAKGITVWIHGWWGGPHLKDQFGAETMRRWWRYIIHRLGAYNVIWVLAGEYNLNNYGKMGLEFWKDLGRMIDEEDPYERIIGTHPTPPAWDGGAEAPQWSTAEVLHQEAWLDYNQSQVGHGKWRNEMIPLIIQQSYQAQPPKPIVVTEPWYEFIEGISAAVDIRFGAWSAILSGAAGHTYGGGHVWRAHVPESPAGSDSYPMDLSFETNTLDYPGARSLGFLSKYLQLLPWWKLEPHPELVQENPSPYCSALPGQEYLVYLRWGGTLKLDLSPAGPNTSFHYEWVDLTEEKVKRSGTVSGGVAVEFQPPEDYPGSLQYKDWVLHVVKE